MKVEFGEIFPDFIIVTIIFFFTLGLVMAKKILLSIALLVMLFDLSSCTMRVVSGTPYRIWKPGRGFHKHWGRERHMNVRRSYWGHHRSGMRPHRYRGHFHE